MNRKSFFAPGKEPIAQGWGSDERDCRADSYLLTGYECHDAIDFSLPEISKGYRFWQLKVWDFRRGNK